MARIDVAQLESNATGGEALVQLGLIYAAGADIPADRVAAHKWFNLAASRGSLDAIRLRRELAEEMSPAEIAAAQRAARQWLTTH